MVPYPLKRIPIPIPHWNPQYILLCSMLPFRPTDSLANVRNSQTYASRALRQQYPPANPSIFMASANSFQQLMRDAQRILNRIHGSREFSVQLKEAAQRSDRAKVEQLVQSTGAQSEVKTLFTPDRIRFELRARDKNCCQLEMALSW